MLEDNPYGLLRYEGEPLPTLYSLDGGEFVIYLGTFSKILSPGIRLGWAAAPRPVLQKMNLGKQAADLCSSSMTQLFVADVLRSRATGASYVDSLIDALPPPPRHDARRAAPSTSRARPRGRSPQGGLFIWATLPDYIDTTDLLARALRENVAFVPGPRGVRRRPRRLVDAAELLRRPTRTTIREGVRRIGKVVARAGRAVRDADRRGAAARRRSPSERRDRGEPAARRRAASCRGGAGRPRRAPSRDR